MASSADVVFAFPPTHGNVGVFGHHLGVSYLRTVLRQAGMTTAQYLNDHPGSVDSVAAELLAFKPKVVGLTSYDASFPLCLALARSLKRHRPSPYVVLGGPTATFGADNILSRHDAFDFCIRGETEEIGRRVFEALLGDDLAGCEVLPGVAFRRGSEVISTDLPPLVGCGSAADDGLDSIPSPYLTELLTDGKSGVLSGRGCTHHCQYCCFAALGRKQLRLHSVERVLAELEYISAGQKRTGEKHVVAIHDDAFTLAPERAKKLCQMIADRDLGLVLSCITRADKVDDELLDLMKAAGFVGLAFGLESAVPSVLRATGKVRPPDWPDPDLGPEREFVERVRSSVTAARKRGLNVGVSMILGLPTERAEDGLATLQFVEGLPIDYYMHNFLWVFPGTPLWDTGPRYGIETTIDSLGLPTTVRYAYDVAALKPGPKCSLDRDAIIPRLLAADALFGCEAFDESPAQVATAVVRAGEISDAMAAWLAKILDIGGLLVQVYPPQNRLEEPLRLYCDRTVLSEHLVPVRHHVQALPRQSKVCDQRWLLACPGADLYCIHRPSLVSIKASRDAKPLIDWARGTATACDLCEPAEYLQSPCDLVQFLDRLDGEDLGARMRRMRVPPGFTYPGRWLRGRAPCLSLSRIEIDQSGAVRCCRHGGKIGEIGDRFETLVENLAALARDAERRRGCDTCPSADCPRCPFPGLDESAYCRMMNRDDRVPDLLNLLHVYSKLVLVLETKQDRLKDA